MSAFETDPFAPAPMRLVPIDVYTASYRVSGKLSTRFNRVGDIVNQATSSHLAIEEATISEYTDPTATISAMQALVSLDEALIVIAAEGDAAGRDDMRIQKRAVRAQLGLPPFRITGSLHIAPGSRSADGILFASDRYLVMTEATIASGPHPDLARTAPAIAFRRQRAHFIVVTDDERPDELLADVLDAATAERWLQQAREPEEAEG
jgi:hypothetical protein